MSSSLPPPVLSEVAPTAPPLEPTVSTTPAEALLDPLAPGVPFLERWVRLWHAINRAVDVRVAVLMAFCGGWLVINQLHCSVRAFDQDIKPLLTDWNPYLKPAFGHLYWFLSGPFMLFAIPLAVGCLLLKCRPADLGVAVGHWRSGLKWTFGIYACFLPVVVTVSFASTFKRTYPLNRWVGTETVAWLTGTGGSPWPFLAYEGSYGVYFIGWEFFFRGLIGFGLFRALGWYSVLVATIPFAVMHVGKPEPEALGSVLAGIALGVFALKERSFLYGALLHALVAWTMDFLAIFHRWRETLPQ